MEAQGGQWKLKAAIQHAEGNVRKHTYVAIRCTGQVCQRAPSIRIRVHTQYTPALETLRTWHALHVQLVLLELTHFKSMNEESPVGISQQAAQI